MHLKGDLQLRDMWKWERKIHSFSPHLYGTGKCLLWISGSSLYLLGIKIVTTGKIAK